jgi:hypothetical protein
MRTPHLVRDDPIVRRHLDPVRDRHPPVRRATDATHAPHPVCIWVGVPVVVAIAISYKDPLRNTSRQVAGSAVHIRFRFFASGRRAPRPLQSGLHTGLSRSVVAITQPAVDSAPTAPHGLSPAKERGYRPCTAGSAHARGRAAEACRPVLTLYAHRDHCRHAAPHDQ